MNSASLDAAVLADLSVPIMITASLEEHRLAEIPASVSSFICFHLPCNEARVKTKKGLDTPSQKGTDSVIHIWGHYYHTHQANPRGQVEPR